MNMVAFVAKMIEKEAKKSIEAGQAKYRAYFIRTHLYEDVREDVEAILCIDGYEACIVTE